jgi:hypothetical protein
MDLTIVDGDLLDQDVEVIVNAWNRNIIPWWLLLPQGVSGAIKKRAGYGPFRELGRKGSIPLWCGRNKCWPVAVQGDHSCRWNHHAVAIFRAIHQKFCTECHPAYHIKGLPLYRISSHRCRDRRL